jgi:molecular chaperone GrpE (heat shock protein)
VVEDEGAEHRAHVQREMELKSAKARAVALEAQNKELQEQLERKQEEFEQLTASAEIGRAHV